jgi:UDP-2,3-diacylglucosamine hydrolase
MDRFERFLFEDLPAIKVHRLFLLGDVFNIWYRDDRMESLYGRRILKMLERFLEAGGAVEWVVGNRDFALCFDRNLDLPFPIHRTAIQRKIGRLSFYLCHGDDLCKKDYSYRLLHGAIRQQFPMDVFHSLPSAKKEWIVAQLINLTHEITRRKAFWKTQPHHPFIAGWIDRGIDVIVQGHRHYRTYTKVEGARRMGRLFVLPRWYQRASGLVYDPQRDEFSFFDRP